MLLLALIGLVAAPPLDRQWSFDTPSDVEVAASNINGRIRVEAGDDRQVTIRATSADPGDFTVEVSQESDGVFARVCCQGSCDGERREGWPRRECDSGRIDLLLRVPAGARLAASNVTGRIEVAGVRGKQRIENVSGGVSIEGSEETLRIHVVSGRARIAPSRVARTSVHSVSGNVELALPRNAGASVALESLSGGIVSNLEEGRSRGSRRLDVRGGGPSIEVHSVSGSIHIVDR